MGGKKSSMDREAARRIQSSQDRKGKGADDGFKRRAMSAAEKNERR